jgi:hypothetical protein
MTMETNPPSGRPLLPLQSSISDENLGLNVGAPPLRLGARRRSPPCSMRGWFASPKALGPAPFESLLERDAQSVVSADSKVEAYAVQCHRLTYFIHSADGVQRRQYVPDLVAKMRDGRRVVVEVRAYALAQRRAWTSLEPHIRRAYQEDHNAEFRLITEEHIRRQPQLSNAQVMLAHCGVVPPSAEMSILQIVEDEGPISIRGLSEVLVQLGFSYAETFTSVMQCALADKVALDHAEEFSPKSLVWKRQ